MAISPSTDIREVFSVAGGVLLLLPVFFGMQHLFAKLGAVFKVEVDGRE
jgi:hypothetical protein